jgi:hypothetical protein
MPNEDKTFLFVLYVCSAEGALGYKKNPLLIVEKPSDRKAIKYIILWEYRPSKYNYLLCPPSQNKTT